MEHQHDWEQREQLSALLDNELGEQERAELEAHLPSCAACRAELESLRRTRNLVRALPQPPLPRSFALPLEAAPRQEQPHQSASAARPAPGPQHRPSSAPPARLPNRRRPVRALQWLSSIAAVLGVVVLLSGFFSSHTSMTAATSTASFGNNQGQTANAPMPTNTQPSLPERTPNGTHPGLGTPSPTTETPAATSTTDDGHTLSQNPPSGASSSPFFSITGLGVLLLLLGASGFAISWALRRRW